MTKKTVAFCTLGCRVNQYETRAVEEAFLEKGFAVGKFTEKCDAYVINTCTVTGESDRKSRQMIRRAVKNGKGEEDISKVYYNEHVYRVSKGTGSFKEFTQVGLECFGKLDDYSLSEVIFLATKSLESISEEYVLDLSHLGIVNGVLDAFSVSALGKKKIIEFLGDKNAHGIDGVCKEEGIDEKQIQTVKKLVSIYGAPEKVFLEIDKLNKEVFCANN